MISLAGNTILILSLCSALFAIILRDRLKLICFCIASFLPAIALFLLMYAFLISDFSLKNVFFNSSSTLPIIYKISACWASHEGSILLWYSLLCLVGSLYIISSKFSDSSKEIGVYVVSFIQILFCSFIIFTSSPFDSLSFQPEEGLGLNPMLQDVALAIHPPLLYMGSVSFIATFTGGILLLFKPFEQKEILRVNTLFINIALAFLTIGIGLGSWWAYRELGWGGYWFFDPVENVSLLPWIAGIALHHFTILSKRKELYLAWTIFLSILAFLLIIYGTFIVRSGIISSIHAFAFSPERGFYIFSICIVLTILSFSLFIIKRKSLFARKQNRNLQSEMIFWGNILWLATLLILIVSLIYPIYCSLVNNIDIVIDPEYFKKIYLPIHLPIILLAAFAPSIYVTNWLKKLILFAVAMFISIVLLMCLNINNSALLPKIFILCSIFLIIQTIDYLYVTSLGFSKSISNSIFSLFLGHLGFGLLILSITLNVLLTKEIEFIGGIGKKLEKNDFVVKLENIKFADGPNYYRQIAEFSIEYGNNITVLRPENRLYKIENTLSQEIDIYSFLFHDIYAVLNQVSKKQIVRARIYYQPFISFIWFSVFLMSLGFLLLIRVRKHKTIRYS